MFGSVRYTLRLSSFVSSHRLQVNTGPYSSSAKGQVRTVEKTMMKSVTVRYISMEHFTVYYTEIKRITREVNKKNYLLMSVGVVARTDVRGTSSPILRVATDGGKSSDYSQALNYFLSSAMSKNYIKNFCSLNRNIEKRCRGYAQYFLSVYDTCL